jgi:hypothetical protein
MTGPDLATQLSRTIGILETTKNLYETTGIRDDQSLEETFHKAGQGVTLVKDALEAAQGQLSGPAMDPGRAMKSLEACSAKAQLCEEIFKEVARAQSPKVGRYREVVGEKSPGRGVVDLVKGMMEDVLGLANDGAIKAGMAAQIKRLSEGIATLELEHPGGNFSHHGSGDQNNNTGIGKQLIRAVFNGTTNIN